MPLEVGAKAPEFSSADSNGNILSLGGFRGKWVVLYFYPKDNTPGCTREACDFRDSLDSLSARGIEVIGVSPDSPASHDKFRAKYNLNFHLASDADKSISNAYGVWVLKNFMGKKYMGVERTTYVIDPEGVIRRVFSKVKVNGHIAEVEKAVDELNQDAKSNSVKSDSVNNIR